MCMFQDLGQIYSRKKKIAHINVIVLYLKEVRPDRAVRIGLVWADIPARLNLTHPSQVKIRMFLWADPNSAASDWSSEI
jgi:hypothetical protein